MAIKSRGLIDEDDPRVAKIGHPAPPWLINYADLMTEIVCFFVIMYAMEAALSKGVSASAQDIQQTMQQENISGTVEYTKEGLKISLDEKGDVALFQSGSAELTEKAIEVIDKLAPELKKLPNDIEIEGHTDSAPISTARYPSNWELSTARATSVLRHLVDKQEFKPERMGAVGYAEFKPAAKNDTPENMQKNRRVVFLIKNKGHDKVIAGVGKDGKAIPLDKIKKVDLGKEEPDQGSKNKPIEKEVDLGR